MKLILITRPDFFVEEHKIINALFEEGLDALHIRKPQSEPIFCERLIRLIDKTWYKRITVQDHFYLRSEFGLAGIHLTERNPEVPAGYTGNISRSCHSIAELAEWRKTCNLLFLSPIFGNFEPEDTRPLFPMSELEQAKENGLIGKRTVAMGGINPRRIAKARQLGFGGVAVMNDIWQRFDTHDSSSFQEIIKEFRTLKKLTDQ